MPRLAPLDATALFDQIGATRKYESRESSALLSF
jgi:hypothetical protein